MNDQGGHGPSYGVAINQKARPPETGLREVLTAAPPAGEGRVSFAEILRVIRGHLWLVAAILTLCLAGAVVVSLLIRPEYMASVTLEVNPEGNQSVQIGEVPAINVNDFSLLETQAGLLRSRSLAERVVRTLNLAGNEEFVGTDEGTRDAREAIAVNKLMRSVTVTPLRDTRLIEVEVISFDPALAARIGNAYAENFIQSGLERRFEATSYARRFLEERLASVRERLEDSERQLVAYAQQQGIINIPSGSGDSKAEQSLDATALVSLNEALSQARAERVEAEQRFRQTSGARSSSDIVNNPTVQTLSTERAQLEAEYQEKLGVFRPDYPQMVQLRSRIEALDKSIAAASSRVSRASSGQLRGEFEAAVGRENALQARVNQLKEALLNLRGRSIQYTILQREVDTNRSLYDALLQRYREVGVAGGVGTNVISVIDRAEVPDVPFKPNLPLNVVIGLLAGLVIGLGAAFALEWMDDTIKVPDDLTAKLGLSPLGLIPVSDKNTSVREALEDPRSPVSEAYHSVRAALQFSTDHGVPRSLLVTSTRASEGKSSTALALAQTLSRLGANVLLVDADLRKPTFRGPSGASEGLSSVLAGASATKDCCHPTEVDRLFLLPSGPIPPNPAELLSSARLGEAIEELVKIFDHVVIDGPPVLGLADAPLLANRIEGTLMVIEAGSIRRAAALNAVNRLRAGGARLMGGILTKFQSSKVGGGYGYGYGYGYGEDLYAYREGSEPKRQIVLLKNT
jgi:polysaccharide biosynthesis transport protein